MRLSFDSVYPRFDSWTRCKINIMGMYDTVKINTSMLPMSKEGRPKLGDIPNFQTKDLESRLVIAEITNGGRLIYDGSPLRYTGAINFYGSGLSFCALFQDGVLLSLKNKYNLNIPNVLGSPFSLLMGVDADSSSITNTFIYSDPEALYKTFSHAQDGALFVQMDKYLVVPLKYVTPEELSAISERVESDIAEG